MLIYYRDVFGLFKNMARRMWDDMETYKNQIRNLEIANAQLMARVDSLTDKKDDLIKQAELNEMDRAILQKKYRKLKSLMHKIYSQTCIKN
jgi:hypothetical protein